MTRLKIRTRLALLSGALLLVLALTTGYLTHRISAESAAMVRSAELLRMIERANSARLSFGELRYWNTDLAVSLLTLAERKAAAAPQRPGHELERRPAPAGLRDRRAQRRQYRGADPGAGSGRDRRDGAHLGLVPRQPEGAA